MAYLNQATLSAIGVVKSGAEVKVPLYILQRAETVYFNDIPIHVIYSQPSSLKALASIVLQIVDFQKFIR
jgi:hypothetical protein